MSFLVSGSNTWHETALILDDGDHLCSSSLYRASSGGAIGRLLDRSKHNHTLIPNISEHQSASHDGWVPVVLGLAAATEGDSTWHFVTGTYSTDGYSTDVNESAGEAPKYYWGQTDYNPIPTAIWTLDALPAAGYIKGLKIRCGATGSVWTDPPGTYASVSLKKLNYTGNPGVSETVIGFELSPGQVVDPATEAEYGTAVSSTGTSGSLESFTNEFDVTATFNPDELRVGQQYFLTVEGTGGVPSQTGKSDIFRIYDVFVLMTGSTG